MDPRPLASSFLEALSDASGWPHAETLAPLLVEVCAAGRSAWSGIHLEDERLARWIAERIERPADLSPERAPDWFIACACASGSGPAVAAFETRFFPELAPALRRLKLDAAALEEALQRLREELFVARPGGVPRIALYRGRGELGGWLRVTAVRSALKMLRGRRDVSLEQEEMVDRVAADADDPDLSYMKALYRPAFKAAFQEALESLSSRDQNLLRQQVLDGLSVDELGALYRVHRATAARWVAQARELLVRRTRQSFQRRIRIDNAECDSIMRMIQSQLDVTIRRRLAAAG